MVTSLPAPKARSPSATLYQSTARPYPWPASRGRSELLVVAATTTAFPIGLAGSNGRDHNTGQGELE
jgi:hypothetical protein